MNPESRQYKNLLLADLIAKTIYENPDLRFGQLLMSLEIVQFGESTFFYEESSVTLDRAVRARKEVFRDEASKTKKTSKKTKRGKKC